ncbi:metallophosphoesterase [Desulfonatronovibrio magnus]|uniref:metallophosphoesterase n=1 Tax=Desulfonatronovibrio magnus TaxID=698827 RepID=UPI0005EB9D79|nr:metallophosphoesterase [Desulfonatronovibrio magnus]RQD66759.1 MAG: serine/threonine protein phosphatase [Desulfonatronovibrio sp. MSAO_Bac4]
MAEKFWIAFGDVHENLRNIHKVKDIREAAGVLVSGDLTNVGNRSRAGSIIDEIKAFNSNVYAQIGNMDTKEVEKYLNETGANIHKKLVALSEDVHVLGLGYSTPTPFSTPSEVSEEQVKSWLDSILKQAMEVRHLIFITHTPPQNTKADRLGAGANVGSPAVRAFIEKVQPEVCVTGHIHEARSVDHVGRTIVINPGTFGSGGYVRITFDGTKLDAELRAV